MVLGKAFSSDLGGVKVPFEEPISSSGVLDIPQSVACSLVFQGFLFCFYRLQVLNAAVLANVNTSFILF